MYYYIKARKKGTIDWKAVREDGRILIFNNIEATKKHTTIENFVFEIVSFSHHPSNKQSQIYGKKYKKIGW